MTIEIDENDLHAFLDGQLAPEQEAVVLAWLETNPEARQRLHDYAEQKLLMAIGASEGVGEADLERTEELAEELAEELGVRLQQALTKRRPLVWLREAAGSWRWWRRAGPPTSLSTASFRGRCRLIWWRRRAASGFRRGSDAAGGNPGQ